MCVPPPHSLQNVTTYSLVFRHAITPAAGPVIFVSGVHVHTRTHARTHTHTQCTYTMTLCIVGSCWSSLEQFIPEVLCVLSSPYLGGGQVCFWPSRQQLSAVACASHRLQRPQTDHHCDSICWDNCNYHWDYSGRHGHCCHSDEVSIQTSHTPASHQ